MFDDIRSLTGCIKLHSETQVSGRLGMSGGRSPRHAQNPLSGEERKTLSITHHALSPPPLHHHLYIIHLINWLQRFYRITMSLKRPFVPKCKSTACHTRHLCSAAVPKQSPIRWVIATFANWTPNVHRTIAKQVAHVGIITWIFSEHSVKIQQMFPK